MYARSCGHEDAGHPDDHDRQPAADQRRPPSTSRQSPADARRATPRHVRRWPQQTGRGAAAQSRRRSAPAPDEARQQQQRRRRRARCRGSRSRDRRGSWRSRRAAEQQRPPRPRLAARAAGTRPATGTAMPTAMIAPPNATRSWNMKWTIAARVERAKLLGASCRGTATSCGRKCPVADRNSANPPETISAQRRDDSSGRPSPTRASKKPRFSSSAAGAPCIGQNPSSTPRSTPKAKRLEGVTLTFLAALRCGEQPEIAAQDEGHACGPHPPRKPSSIPKVVLLSRNSPRTEGPGGPNAFSTNSASTRE